jgi:uncharacterized protein
MMIPRTELLARLRGDLKAMPVVVLLGPRQVGKTTLARQIIRDFPDALYLDLESSNDRRKLEDPRGFLSSQTRRLTVLDEVQHVPELFYDLRGIVDSRKAAGELATQFLLLGSASLELVQKASETLAGRVVYFEMSMIGVVEANTAGIDTETLWA